MRIGVLTSGGDAPGMNAALRTVAVVGIAKGHTVLGVKGGYQGLLAGDAEALEIDAVDGISRFGGTVLGSARSKVFPTEEGQAEARRQIENLGLDALVVIGGNGSLTGAHLLAESGVCRVVGLPASIDNDIGHCGLAIGVDTAVNTIVEACDRISDTASAHHRAFLVDVMGRQCGFLAMRAGIAAEADAILYGEQHLSEDEIVARLEAVLSSAYSGSRQKRRVLIVKSEGVEISTTTLVRRLQEYLDRNAPGVDIRATVLGHVVRGGGPSALDRVIAQRLGYAAVLACEAGATDVMMSWDVPGGFGQPTPDPFVRVVPLPAMLAETVRLLDGTSPVVQQRMELLRKVEALLAL